MRIEMTTERTTAMTGMRRTGEMTQVRIIKRNTRSNADIEANFTDEEAQEIAKFVNETLRQVQKIYPRVEAIVV